MSEEASQPYAPPQARTLERGEPQLPSHQVAVRLAYTLAAHYLRVALFALGGSVLATLAASMGPSAFRVGYLVSGLLILVGGFVVLVLGIALALAALAVEWTRGRRLVGWAVALAGLLSGGLLILPFLLFVRRSSAPTDREAAGPSAPE